MDNVAFPETVNSYFNIFFSRVSKNFGSYWIDRRKYFIKIILKTDFVKSRLKNSRKLNLTLSVFPINHH